MGKWIKRVLKKIHWSCTQPLTITPAKYIGAEGFLEHSPSREGLYYKGPALQKIIWVFLRSPFEYQVKKIRKLNTTITESRRKNGCALPPWILRSWTKMTSAVFLLDLSIYHRINRIITIHCFWTKYCSTCWGIERKKNLKNKLVFMKFVESVKDNKCNNCYIGGHKCYQKYKW